ncbi:MAG TPA: DUF6088 family protein [Flavobacterium sp.]|nr:DUF6088 family protein [Flavobacterium sp.]
MQSIHNQIDNKISNLKKGTILFIADFADFGTVENVKKVLLRLEKKQVLVRLAHGIYLYPKVDKDLGVLFPSTESIAEAIAKRDKTRIIPTGFFALQQLGISIQTPMNIVYLTDGAARKITVGKRIIIFKKTAPKNLAIKNKILSDVVQGLKELGKNNVEDPVREKIKTVLEKIPEEILNAPIWIRNEIFRTK